MGRGMQGASAVRGGGGDPPLGVTRPGAQRCFQVRGSSNWGGLDVIHLGWSGSGVARFGRGFG